MEAIARGAIPPISILPAFTVLGALVDSLPLLLAFVLAYYILSTRIISRVCTVLNAALWPIGFILSLVLWNWVYAILYAAAFVFLCWAARKGFMQ